MEVFLYYVQDYFMKGGRKGRWESPFLDSFHDKGFCNYKSTKHHKEITSIEDEGEGKGRWELEFRGYRF